MTNNTFVISCLQCYIWLHMIDNLLFNLENIIILQSSTICFMGTLSMHLWQPQTSSDPFGVMTQLYNGMKWTHLWRSHFKLNTSFVCLCFQTVLQSKQFPHSLLFQVGFWFLSSFPSMTEMVFLKFIDKIKYHAVGDTWWQPLLYYGKWCTEFKIGSFIY